jgi:hypothetical protein
VNHMNMKLTSSFDASAFEYGRGLYRVLSFTRTREESQDPPPTYFAFACKDKTTFNTIAVTPRDLFAKKLLEAPCAIEGCYELSSDVSLVPKSLRDLMKGGKCACKTCRQGYQLQVGELSPLPRGDLCRHFSSPSSGTCNKHCSESGRAITRHCQCGVRRARLEFAEFLLIPVA